MNRRRMMMEKGWDGIVYKEGESSFRKPFEYKTTTSYGNVTPYVWFLNQNWFAEGVYIGASDNNDYCGVSIGPVDFTGFKTLNIQSRRAAGTSEQSKYFYCGYSEKAGTDGEKISFISKQNCDDSSKTIYSFDISSVKGKKYITFEYISHGLGIYNIWLE